MEVFLILLFGGIGFLWLISKAVSGGAPAPTPTRPMGNAKNEKQSSNAAESYPIPVTNQKQQPVNQTSVQHEPQCSTNWNGEKISPELGMSLSRWYQLKSEIKADQQKADEQPHTWTEWERGNAWEWGLHNVSGTLGQKWYEDLPPADGTTPPDDQPRRDDNDGYAGYY